jgi:multidrug resistance protein
MADSKTQSIMTDEKTLEVDHPSSATPSESRGSDSQNSSKHNNEKMPELVTEPAKRGSIDPDVENGISLVNPVEDKDEEGGADSTTHEQDPNVVDWDSKDDPERAINWTPRKKWANMAIIGSVTFLTPLASSMVAPGVPLILRDFHSTDATVGSLIVSIYILGYALGPLFIAPMSEVFGRLPVYHANNILFIVWTVGCALAPNVGSLLAFRVLAGIAGSCPITIGGGSIADLFAQQERGAAMAIFALGPLMGPVVGPVAGGYLSEAKGWRWVFWVITIAAGAACISSITFMRETYEPVLLQKRVNKLKKETGNQQLRSKLDSGLTVREYFTRALIRPTKMLIFSPIVLLLSIYMAVVYGYLYLLFTTLTLVFERDYHFSQGNVGLVFLGIGVGSLLGLFIFGLASDRIVKRMSAKGEMKPEYRLPPLIPGSLIIPIGLFWYGWSCKAHLHWIMPIIGTMFVGLGLLATFMPIQTYLVDAFTIHAASAIAANTVLRSLVGAFLPLAGPAMYAKLGLGWGNSLLAFIALALAPISWIFFKYGERIRKSPRFQVKF